MGFSQARPQNFTQRVQEYKHKARAITPEEKQYVHDLLARARRAMDAIEHYDQARIDRLCQAVGWATSNETTFTRLANMSVDESGLGDRQGRPNRSEEHTS